MRRMGLFCALDEASPDRETKTAKTAEFLGSETLRYPAWLLVTTVGYSENSGGPIKDNRNRIGLQKLNPAEAAFQFGPNESHLIRTFWRGEISYAIRLPPAIIIRGKMAHSFQPHTALEDESCPKQLPGGAGPEKRLPTYRKDHSTIPSDRPERIWFDSARVPHNSNPAKIKEMGRVWKEG